MRRLRAPLLAVVLVALSATSPGVAGALAATPTVHDGTGTLLIEAAGKRVVIDKLPWRVRLQDTAGRTLASEAPSRPLESMTNPDAPAYRDRSGSIDLAYPGLSTVAYQPLAFLRAGSWRHVSVLRTFTVSGGEVRMEVGTSDGGRAQVNVAVADDGAVRFSFRPPGDSDAVAEAFDAPLGERYFGGGQRFGGLNQRGRSVPLWISHGQSSDRYGSTNEIAVPFLMSSAGWSLGIDSSARGEMNVALPIERPDALNVVLEQNRLDFHLYGGTPAAMLASYTARAGRPREPTPEWAFRPAYWLDEGNTETVIDSYVARLGQEGLPAGAFWIDNPWEKKRGELEPDPKRFADFDRMVAGLHSRQVRTVNWISPFLDPHTPTGQTATRTHQYVGNVPGDDQTYIPPRGLDDHLDLTNPRAFEAFVQRARGLLERGVDGFKADRGEEDLGDGSRWADGRPNRLNHNPYVERYHAALAEACRRAGRARDCFIIARGGAAGSQRHATVWAGDNLSAPGPAGLGQALNSLLSLSVSGYPVSGSDIGGYTGTRSDVGKGAPTKGLYLRWTQLGALSPIMQTLYPPWDFDAQTVAIFRRYANLHARLSPWLVRWSREATAHGMPIVRPLPFAYPSDSAAQGVTDEYLLGPDLLVAPVTDSAAEEPQTRSVYLPAGAWRDAWTGERLSGPRTLAAVAPLDRIPLYVREGGAITLGLFAGLDAHNGPPACGDRTAPRSRILAGARLRRGRLALTGRSSDAGCGEIAHVAVAVARVVHGGCQHLGADGRFGPRANCLRRRFFPARGRDRWRFETRARFPRGRYVVRSRASDGARNFERRGTRDNARRLRLR